MKKIYIAMAVVATAALASCQQEKSFNDENLGENSVVFAIKSGSTRSAEVAPETRQGIVIPLETESGSKFILEETVTSLDQFSPATKGAPAYTENLGTLYANDLNVWGDKGGFGTDATYESMESSQYPRKDADLGSGWRYHHAYSGDPWPGETEDVGFYLNMPAAPTGVSITGHTGGKFTFTYTSPATAAEQQDILFAYRATNKSEYLDDFHPNGIPVLFNHALTAVKFAIGNTDADKVVIKEVIFKNLIDKGTCTITPVGEAGDYKDIDDNYSSATAASWASTSSSGNDITSGTYGDPVDYESGEFGASWYSAGNENNLNKADGSQTFWLVPQTFDANSTVQLTIKYTVNGEEDDWTIDFGKALANVTWEAGELRTYTIKVDDVNVKIEDTVTVGQGQTTTYTDDKGNVHTIYGGTKNGIVVTNTGNTDAFMRVAITGQWVDADGAPVFSFTDYTVQDIIQEIASWYNDQFGTGNGHFGVFDGLVGYTKNGKTGAGNEGWVKGKDGYYYYTTKVAPNATTGTAPFNSYTVTLANVPKIKVAGELQEVHFVMEVSTQAISAKTLTGGDYNWYDAWKNATGEDPRSN